MSAFSGREDLTPPYRVVGGTRFDGWAKDQHEVLQLELRFWTSGLYWKPWQAPSIPLGEPGHGPPDDVRRAVITIDGFPSVVVDYDVWEDLGVVRLLRFRTS